MNKRKSTEKKLYIRSDEGLKVKGGGGKYKKGVKVKVEKKG